MSELPKRRWFHFSIRDLMLLTVIVALGVGWWLDHRAQQRENAMLRGALDVLRDAIETLQERIEAIPGNPLPTSSAPAPNPPKD